MAGPLPAPSCLVVAFAITAILCASAATPAAAVAEQHRGFLRSQRPAPRLRRQKLSHFRLYWHDIVGGRNATAVQVAGAASTNSSATRFGMVIVIDNPLTEGPELSSKLVGRAQGMYASASQSELGLMMAMNFAFTVGKYNGSTVTILGRNRVFSEVREMPVIGGSGLFRFATGYCRLRTHTFDTKKLYAVVEYNIFVFHY